VADNNFYRAFEDRYRGSRELIKSRLSIYLPFIQPLQQFYPSIQGIDLGCGRGEWLELMQENGIAVQGVDMDQGMLTVAQERGLNVTLGDAIKKLQTLSSESQTLVSGFHLAEHLPFETLQVLIQESLRVLKPGGLLILETPNPENITVGTEKFYLDPSHYRPIPSQFLSFMAEYAGFPKVKVLRLQEPSGLAETNSLILLSVLNGVSPDYAIVAQKGCSAEIQSTTASAFEADYGLSLERLANNYDRQIKISIQQAVTKAQQADAKAQQADAKAQEADAKAQEADVKAQQAEAALIAIRTSSSWRITAPLRKISIRIISILNFAKNAKSKIKNNISLLLLHAFLYLNRRPHFHPIAKLGFLILPSIKFQVEQAAKVASSQKTMAFIALKPMDLTPRAHRIYEEIKAATAKPLKEKL